MPTSVFSVTYFMFVVYDVKYAKNQYKQMWFRQRLYPSIVLHEIQRRMKYFNTSNGQREIFS